MPLTDLRDQLRSLLRGFPAGVAVLTVDAEGERLGLTVGCLVSLSLEPPLVCISVSRESAMHELYPGMLGDRPLILALHGSVAVTFILFRAALFWQRWRQARQVRVDSP